MPALILAALLGLDAPVFAPDLDLAPFAGAGADSLRLAPAGLLAVELGAGLVAGTLAMPAVYLVSLVFGGLGDGASLDLMTMVLGTLLLPPTAAAGTVWAMAWLHPTRAPRFAPAIATAGATWAVVLAAGSLWHGSVWDFAYLLTDGLFRTPGAAIPWLLGGAAVLAASATIAVNLTTVRRLEPGPWQRPVEHAPEDPFAQARPSPLRHEPARASLVVSLWAGRF